MKSNNGPKLAELAALVGPDGMADALDVAIEAAKMALNIEDLFAGAKARAWLQYLGGEPRVGQGFVSWAVEHNLVTPAQIAEAENLDILGMRDA